ncbi:hypothetical protein ACFOYW_15890 [Gryllotalpicola reticulitermitis]|uniref:Ig-like domain (Group 3) n=1 Tax=Gryllotalpicola reticulitermitis TaxID=1184153 RepID=A0ABV8Q903_9MICO
MSSRSFKRALIAGVACTATIAGVGAFGAGAAFADPTGTTTGTVSTAPKAEYVAVGSDTIQSLYDGFADGYTNGAGKQVAPILGANGIASWLATGSNTIVPSNGNVATGANAIGRPANSGDGRAALSAAWNTKDDGWTQTVNNVPTTYTVTPHSIDIARSSGKPSTIVNPGDQQDNLTSIPLARDAVSVVINDEPTLDGVISASTIAAIYNAPDNTSKGVNGPNFADGDYQQTTGVNTAGDVRNTAAAGQTPVEQVFDGTNWITVHPYLPFNAGSGTRQFFQTAIGSTKTAAPGTGLNSGITMTDGSGNPIIENTGAIAANPGDIAPFSAAQWIAQHNGTAPNTVTDTNVVIVPIQTGTASPALTAVTGQAPHLQPGTLFGDTTAPAAGGFGIFDRDVYSVAATTDLAATPALSTLLSVTLPSAPAVSDYGFDPIPAVSANSANWLHSPFENSAATPATQTTSTSVTVSGVSATTVSLKATVTAPTGFSVPAGDTVTFKNGSTTLGTAKTSAAGTATLSFSAKTGSQNFSFTATYAGHTADAPAPFAASTSSTLSYAAYIVPQDTLSSVKISGTARVGSVLTPSVSGQVSGSSLSYQWKTGSTLLTTASKLTVPASAYKKTITLTVISEKAGYINSAAKTSSATGTVSAGVLSAPTPRISGTTTVGKTLTAVTGTWTSGTSLHYQWKANGASIKGATAHTFKLTSSQAGKKITVTVTGTKTDYTTVAKTSASTKAVAK